MADSADLSYIATEAIFIGRARVANRGDEIPDTHPLFEEWKKDKLVVRSDTKAAKDVTEAVQASTEPAGS